SKPFRQQRVRVRAVFVLCFAKSNSRMAVTFLHGSQIPLERRPQSAPCATSSGWVVAERPVVLLAARLRARPEYWEERLLDSSVPAIRTTRSCRTSHYDPARPFIYNSARI